ncbi:MAG: fused MFS/spermidine synthase [Flavobacteriales bacterium]|nr:fused MFS/spermidine synthase [Flavobacteriales bacterium]
MKKIFPYFILMVAFTEGANLMAVELGAAKLLAPYFGTSLYAWAATLGVTLLALMCGYFAGGILSSKHYSEKKLPLVLFIASCFICLTPVLANFFLQKLYLLPVQLGSTLGLICYAFLPLFFLALSSPLMIQSYLPNTTSAGSAAGSVYAISTLGGIFATFFCGFYTLPTIGIANTLLVFSLSLFLLSFLFISYQSKIWGILFIILYSLCTFFADEFKDDKNALYHSEGILGEIEVHDDSYFSFIKNKWIDGRSLMVNGTGQSIADKSAQPLYTWHYVEVAKQVAQEYKNKKCLLLGMGAGIVAKEFATYGLTITAVELDARIPEIAEKYFIGKNDFHTVVDDARHFINSTNEMFDFIFIDLFFSETPPAHVLTFQSFSKIKNLLHTNGSLLINLYGFSSGKNARPLYSIYNTLIQCGFSVQTIATKGKEAQRNLLLLASVNNKKVEIKTNTESYYLLPFESNKKFPVLTDDINPLEVYFLKPASVWRSGWNKLLSEKK